MVKEWDKASYLFNLQTEYILREAGLEDKHGFKIVEKKYQHPADDTPPLAENANNLSI